MQEIEIIYSNDLDGTQRIHVSDIYFDVTPSAASNDDISGGDGNDDLTGGSGDDYLDGGADSDSLSGSSGNDTLLGDAGDDSIAGQSGNDYIDGGTDEGDGGDSGGKGAGPLTPYQRRLFVFLSVATFFEGFDFLALSQILPNTFSPVIVMASLMVARFVGLVLRPYVCNRAKVTRT